MGKSGPKSTRGGKLSRSQNMRVSGSPVKVISYYDFLRKYSDLGAFHKVGEISEGVSKEILKYADLQGTGVEVSNRQLKHIFESHPKDANFIINSLEDTVTKPDIAFFDTGKHSIILGKRIKGSINIAAVATDKYAVNKSVGNRILSGRRIDNQELRRMIRSKRFTVIFEKH